MLLHHFWYIMTSSYKVMIEKPTLRKEYTTKENWLEDILTNSNSKASVKSAETALRTFDIFCKVKVGLDDPDITDLDMQKAEKLKRRTYGDANPITPKQRYEIDRQYWSQVKARRDVVLATATKQVLQQYQLWFEASDVQSICTSLQSWVRFCSQNHPEVIHYRAMKWKAKKSRSVKSYFASLKDWLRICHGVRITTDDVKDYLKFPKDTKQLPEPLELEHIKLVLGHADPTRRALYYVLITSGMREGEGLSLKRSNFKTDVRPIKVHLHAKDTKTREARDTYITEEAWERVKPIFDKTQEGKYLFHDYEEIYDAVQNESRYFLRLRQKIGQKYNHKNACDEFPNGTGVLMRYENSVRYCVHIHAMRSYFMSIATDVHNESYAHALSGHHAYLDQYIRKPEKQKSKMYLELEKYLLLEGSKVHSEQFHEKEVSELREELEEQKAQIEKLMRNKSASVEFDPTRYGVTS